jgi:hypothetical protein
LKHRILAPGPQLAIPDLLVVGTPIGDWWIRNWDPSYREIRLEDLHSVQELAAIVYDSGVQLGAGSLHEMTGPEAVTFRRREMALMHALDARLRREAVGLVDDLFRGWRELRAR